MAYEWAAEIGAGGVWICGRSSARTA